MRELMDGHDLELRDELYNLMRKNTLFHLKTVGDLTYMQPDYGLPLDTQRELTMDRVLYFKDEGLFKGSLTNATPEQQLQTSVLLEVLAMFDHSSSIKAGVHIHLWGGAVLYLGTKRHHDKWLQATEDYVVRGCFAMTELGHGSNVRGIETVTTYDPTTQEFIINTPCESAQKYWIGGAAMHANHTIVFSQLYIGGRNEGVHAFICKIREPNGEISKGVKVADCGHKIGLNGVDNGRLWFDHVRVPRENLLNSVADVTPEGKYDSAIKDKDQRFGAFLAPLTTGRVMISVCSIYQAKVYLPLCCF
jgi:acyl-CoA oxidase